MADPWMKFYPSDWRADPKLRLVSMAARGLWMEMICLMHEAEPYGDLRVAGVALDEARLARMVGESEDAVRQWLAELREAEVFSVRKNGVIYSRRMEKDYWRTHKMRENGRKGGAPANTTIYNQPGYVYLMRRSGDGWVKIGASVNPKQRLYKVRGQYRGATVELVATCPVADMGASELSLHNRFAGRNSGEWFDLNPSEVGELTSEFLSGNIGLLRGKPTPQKPEARSQIEETPSDEGVGIAPENPGADDPPKAVSTLDAHRIDTAFRMFVAAAERQPGWTVPKAMNRQRRIALAGRIREHGLDGWGQVIERAERSRFLTGQASGDRPFGLTLDWLCKPANLLKVLEGNYDDRTANPARTDTSRPAGPGGAGGRLDAFDRLAERLAGNAPRPDAGRHPDPGPADDGVIDARFTRLTG